MGSKCKKCGATLYPIARVCDACGSLDEYEEVRLSDHISKLYTYSIDKYAGRSDAPLIVQAVAEDPNGCHVYTIMTNVKPEDVQVGMDLEYTFRKIRTGQLPQLLLEAAPAEKGESIICILKMDFVMR